MQEIELSTEDVKIENPVVLVLTVQEMANALKISRPAAYALTRREDFPVLRIGTTIRIPIDGLKEWMKKEGVNC